MKILASDSASHIMEPHKPLYITESGYETPDGELKDLRDFENTVLGIPFKLRIYLEWMRVSTKPDTYQLDWFYVDGSEWNAYDDGEVESLLDGFVDIAVDEFDPELGMSELVEQNVHMHSAIDYDYYSEPAEDAIRVWMEAGGWQKLREKYEDSLDTDDKIILEVAGKLNMKMDIRKIESDGYNNQDVYVGYAGSGADLDDVKVSEVKKGDPDYEWVESTY